MEEYKYAVVSGGLYVYDPTGFYGNGLLAVGGTYCGKDDSSRRDDYDMTEIKQINYSATSYTNSNSKVQLDNTNYSNSNIALKYYAPLTFTSTSNDNVIAAYEHASEYGGGSYASGPNTVVLSGANTVIAKYCLIFYYPGNVKMYEYIQEYSTYPLTHLWWNVKVGCPESGTYMYPKITSCVISNLYDVVLTDKILSSYYE